MVVVAGIPHPDQPFRTSCSHAVWSAASNQPSQVSTPLRGQVTIASEEECTPLLKVMSSFQGAIHCLMWRDKGPGPQPKLGQL